MTKKLQKVLRSELEATSELKSTFKSRIGALEQVHTQSRDSFYRVSLGQPQPKKKFENFSEVAEFSGDLKSKKMESGLFEDRISNVLALKMVGL